MINVLWITQTYGEKTFFALTMKIFTKNKINKKSEHVCIYSFSFFSCGVTDMVVGIKLCDIIQHVDYIS